MKVIFILIIRQRTGVELQVVLKLKVFYRTHLNQSSCNQMQPSVVSMWLSPYVMITMNKKNERRLGCRCYNKTGQLFVRIQKRSEEHTSELQSRFDLVCRLL